MLGINYRKAYVDNKITELYEKCEELEDKLDELVYDYHNEVIEEEDYNYQYNRVTEKIEELKDELDSLHEERGY